MAAEVIRLETRRRGAWRRAVGGVLREWRVDQGLRLSDVAERAGVSTQYLSEVERGRKEASSEVLGAVTEALGGSLSELALGVADGLREAPAHGAAVDRLREAPARSSVADGLREAPAFSGVAGEPRAATTPMTRGSVTLLAA
jgi:transcriptional regulator with XRE-family HTH domain